MIPALLTRMSIGPRRLLDLVEEGGEAGAVGDVEGKADGAVAELGGGSLGGAGVEIADRDDDALAASARASAWPMPRAPPVTTATLPLSERGVLDMTSIISD